MKTKKNHLNFIGIGAQKAGTSWLFNRLNDSEGFCLPYKKELHYFDRDVRYPSPNTLSEADFRKRWNNRIWRKEAVRECFSALKKMKFKQFAWLWKWYFSNYNDDWYLSLFKHFRGISGEISPSYSMLGEADIRKMQQLIPDIKIILLLRNPVERAWSHYRFDHGKFMQQNGLNMDHFKHFIESPGQELRNDYLGCIGRYSKVFPANQIMVGFYDAIAGQPSQLLAEVLNFLGGKFESIPGDQKLQEKVNASLTMEMPVVVRDYLNVKYAADMEKLAVMFPGYCTEWYDALIHPGKQRDFSAQAHPPATKVLS